MLSENRSEGHEKTLFKFILSKGLQLSAENHIISVTYKVRTTVISWIKRDKHTIDVHIDCCRIDFSICLLVSHTQIFRFVHDKKVRTRSERKRKDLINNSIPNSTTMSTHL